MAYLRFGAIALALRSIAAFKDASPFFLYSTSRLTISGFEHTIRLASSSSLGSGLSDTLSHCPSDTYIIVSQPGVSATDYSAKLAAPHLRQWFVNKTERSSILAVPEVTGDLDAHAISRSLEDRCKAEVLKADAATGTIPNDGAYPRIVNVDFSPLPTASRERHSKLAEHDAFLHAVISSLGGDKYTVLYTTSPPEEGQIPAPSYAPAPAYEMDDQYALHSDLKRDLDSHASNGTKADLALFDTYQFLSPGIFMGLLVFLLLFVILYVGISAVSSLQVSYFAFSKEMGPSGQKKQQ